MAYFLILGTGPSTPITDGTGRNYRRRSSALMHNIASYCLIDVTHDFEEQVEIALSVTDLAVTSTSRDAVGGIGNLDRWADQTVTLHAPKAVWKTLSERYGPFTNIVHNPIEPLQAFQAGDLKITALPVDTENGSPRFAYRFDTGKKKVCYASDVKQIPDASEAAMKGNQVLVIDGAGWDKDLPTHRGVLNHIHEYATWNNERLVFTHIGRAAPPHAEASTLIRRMYFAADIAFDFMKLPLGR